MHFETFDHIIANIISNPFWFIVFGMIFVLPIALFLKRFAFIVGMFSILVLVPLTESIFSELLARRMCDQIKLEKNHCFVSSRAFEFTLKIKREPKYVGSYDLFKDKLTKKDSQADYLYIPLKLNKDEGFFDNLNLKRNEYLERLESKKEVLKVIHDFVNETEAVAGEKELSNPNLPVEKGS